MKSLRKFILYITSVFLVLCLGWILFNSIGKVPAATGIFASKNVTLEVLLGALIIGGCVAGMRLWSSSWNEKFQERATFICFFVTFIAQILYLYFVRYYISFDNILVLNEATEMLQTGKISPDFYNGYFQRYPHNYPITVLLYWVIKFFSKLGIKNTHVAACILGLVCMDVALIFAYKIVREIKGVSWGFLFVFITAFDPLIYIWIPWHYTTVCMLPFMSICLYLVIKLYREKKLKTSLKLAAVFGIILACGMKIRVTLVIMVIALIIVAICTKIWKNKNFVRSVLMTLVMFAVAFGACGVINNHYAPFDCSDRGFSAFHYIMMGLEGNGQFNNEDVEYTDSFKGTSAKTSADIKMIKERLNDLGVKGFIKHTLNKMLVTWQDGSCGFEQRWIIPTRYSTPFLYICGEKNDLFLLYAQCFYVMILIITIFGTIISMIRSHMGFGIILRLLLLGNIMFFCIWEAQSHYSIGMMFVFLMLAIDGATECIEVVKNMRSSAVISLEKQSRKFGFTGGIGVMIVVLAVLLYQPLFNTPITYRKFSVRNIYNVGESLTGLTANDEVVQTFSTRIAFNHILVQGYISEPDSVDDGCRIELQDKDGNMLACRNLSADEINVEQVRLDFDPIVPSGETQYRIVIRPQMHDTKQGLNLYRFNGALDMYPNGKLEKNNAEENGDLMFSVYYEDTNAAAYL